MDVPLVYTPRKATLHMNSWAGYQRQDVLVVGETAQRYRVKAPLGGEVKLAGRQRQILFGEGTALVPKTAVTFASQ